MSQRRHMRDAGGMSLRFVFSVADFSYRASFLSLCFGTSFGMVNGKVQGCSFTELFLTF